MPAYEVNFDGLIGPTHNYAGLSRGNIASTAHRGVASNPISDPRGEPPQTCLPTKLISTVSSAPPTTTQVFREATSPPPPTGASRRIRSRILAVNPRKHACLRS